MKIKLFLLGLVAMFMVTELSAYKQQSIDIMVNGQKRNMICYTPTTMQDNIPLWIVTHGMNQTPEYQRDGDHLYELIDTAKFVVCYLRSDGSTWDTGGNKDKNFVLQTIEEMHAKFKINKNRVYWSGFSMGSMLMYHCMPTMLDKIAAFAPCSGIQFSESPWNSCKKPVNLIHCHGKNDSVFPIGQYDPRGYAMHFKDVNGCTTYKKIENYQGLNGSGDKEVWSGGKNGSEVEIFMINWLDHTPDRVYSREIWNFCKRYSLTEGPKVKTLFPEDGSFDMKSDEHREFRISLDKPAVLSKVKATLSRSTSTVTLNVGEEDEGKVLILRVPETKTLANGNWKLSLVGLESADGGMGAGVQATYTYGVEEVGDEMKIDTLYQAAWDGMRESVGEGVPKGWRMKITDVNNKTITKKPTDSIASAKASHLVFYDMESEFASGFQFYPYKDNKVELYTYESSARAMLKMGKLSLRFRTVYLNSKSRSNKFPLSIAITNSSDNSLAFEARDILAKGYTRTGTIVNSNEQEFIMDIAKTTRYNISFVAEHEAGSQTYLDCMILSDPIIITTPSQADFYKGGFLRTMKQAMALCDALKAMAEQGDENASEAFNVLDLAMAQYEGYTSIQPSDYTAATKALEEAMKPGQAVGIQTITGASASAYYDLQGRRIASPVKGIFIKDGRKVMR